MALIRKDHAASSDLGKVFPRLLHSREKEGKEFVEEMAEKSPVEAVRAQAAYTIGWQAKTRIIYENLGFEKKKMTEEERKEMEERAQKYFTLAAKYDDAPMEPLGWVWW